MHSKGFISILFMLLISSFIFGIDVSEVDIKSDQEYFKVMVGNVYAGFSETCRIKTHEHFKYNIDEHTTLKELYIQGWKVIQVEMVGDKIIFYMDKKIQ